MLKKNKKRGDISSEYNSSDGSDYEKNKIRKELEN
jgi:hypothetical protein